MKEIICKGKQLNSKEWVKGQLIRVGDRCFIIYDDDYTYLSTLFGEPQLVVRRFYEVDPETIGQWTGLRDREGVDIFEGDILEGNWLGDRRKGRIVFIDEIASFGIVFEGRKDPCAVLNKMEWFTGHNDHRCEIIGNIHDNPELLERERRKDET